MGWSNRKKTVKNYFHILNQTKFRAGSGCILEKFLGQIDALGLVVKVRVRLIVRQKSFDLSIICHLDISGFK